MAPLLPLDDSGCAQRRKVRVRRNLSGRWVLVKSMLFADVIVPEGVAVRADWLRPSITVLFRGAAAPDLDLDKVLTTLLSQCGHRPQKPLTVVTADALPEDDPSDRLDPPRWSTQAVALLERRAIWIPTAHELPRVYRGTRARFGRTAALRVYCREFVRALFVH
jgi:hypothetical protein